MSLTSFLYERHQAMTHRLAESLVTWRAAATRRQMRAMRRVNPILIDPLEQRMMLSTTVSFASPIAYNPESVAVAVGDFNHDGNTDLATANFVYNTVSILLGKGDGTFQSSVDYSVGARPQSITAADFNNDGNIDLAIANSADGTVSILLGNGNGTFQTKIDCSAGTSPYSAITGDFNGDGKLDLDIADDGNLMSATDSKIRILLGNGNGTFQSKVDYDTGGNPLSIAIGDFNGDGRIDLVVPNVNNKTVGILLGTGDGTFQARTDYVVGKGPSSITVGDFNGDGQNDLAVTNFLGKSVSILLSKGDGTFQAKKDYAVDADPNCAVVGDFNGDGKNDIAVTNLYGNTVSILSGNGDGTFQAKVDFASGTGPWFAASGDFNNDGWLDLTVATGDINGLNVFLNNTMIVSEKHPYSYKDASGNIVVIKLSGQGTAAISRDKIALADVSSIVLSGTTAKSGLTITVTNSNHAINSTTTIGKIDLGSGQLNSLSAAAVDLTGDGLVGGSGSYIKSIKLRDLLNGADIVLGGTAAGVTTTLVAREVGDGSDIQLDSGISSATFVDFGNGTIETSSIGTLKTTGLKSGKQTLSAGDFAGTLTLSGIVGGKGNTLGTASIAGDVLSLAWTIDGTVGAVSAHSFLGDAGNRFIWTSGWITRLAVTKDMINSNLTVDGISTWTVAGDVNTTSATLGNSTSAGKQVLGGLTVGGAFWASSLVSTLGSAGSLHFGQTYSSGLDFRNGAIKKLTVDHDQQGDPIFARTIGSWYVGGSMTSVQATLGSTDTANITVLGSLTIKGDSGQNTLMIAHGNVGSFSAKNLLVSGTSLLLGDGILGSFSVTGNIDVGSVGARFVGSWAVGGNMKNMDALFETGEEVMNKTVSQFKVAGAINGGRLFVHGNNLKSLSASSIANYEIDVTGSLGALSVKSDMSQSTVTVAGNPKTKTLGTWKVGGNLDHVTATFGSSGTENIGHSVLDSLSVGQTISNSTLRAYGGLGVISARRLQTSTILAGYDSYSMLESSETIKSLAISGDAANKSSSFFGNTINAWRIGTLSATYPVGAADTTIKTNRLDSLIVRQLTSLHRYSTVTASSPTITEPGLALSFLTTI